MAGLAWRAPHQEGAFGAVPWRALVLVAGATLFFGLTLRGLGLLPVLLVVVFATAWASRYASLKASTALALGIAAVLLGPVHQGAGPAPAADRPLALPAPTGRRRPPPTRAPAPAAPAP